MFIILYSVEKYLTNKMKKDSKTALKKKSGTTVKVQENKFNEEQILQLALNQVKYEKKKKKSEERD